MTTRNLDTPMIDDETQKILCGAGGALAVKLVDWLLGRRKEEVSEFDVLQTKMSDWMDKQDIRLKAMTSENEQLRAANITMASEMQKLRIENGKLSATVEGLREEIGRLRADIASTAQAAASVGGALVESKRDFQTVVGSVVQHIEGRPDEGLAAT